MDSRDYQMTMGAAINNAVKLVVEGTVELETDDIGAEIAELAQVLYDAVLPQMEKAAGTGGARPTKQSSSGSRSRGSSSSKSSGRSGKKYDGPTKLKGDSTPAQWRLIRNMLEERDHDEDIEWDAVEDLSKQEASDLIGRLNDCDPLE
jgi:hypothetical protein